MSIIVPYDSLISGYLSDLEFRDRFYSASIQDRSGCQIWPGPFYPNGYGFFNFRSRKFPVHRVAWALKNGPFPTGGNSGSNCVLHSCDVKSCVYWGHLSLGDRAENARQRVSRGRGRAPGRQGESHHNTNLSESDVLAIRALGVKRAHSQEAIAKKFGVGVTCANFIISGRSWAHLPMIEGEVRIAPRNWQRARKIANADNVTSEEKVS